jgi:predicted DNA-binding transcriptional regulator AlpA
MAQPKMTIQKSNAAAGSAAARVRHYPKFLQLDRHAQHIANLANGANPNELLCTKQLAAWLGRSKQWVEIGRSRGYGPPYIKLGPRSIRYSVGDVLKWLQERSYKSTAEYESGESPKIRPAEERLIAALERGGGE